MPKFALLVRATPSAESGTPPTTALISAMLKYNTSLNDAGILLAGEGFLPSAKGARITYNDGNSTTVTPGPFAVDTLVSGFWIIKAEDLNTAIAWARKAPFDENNCQVEVRQIAGADDFGEQMTAELRATEEDLRKEIEERVAGKKDGK